MEKELLAYANQVAAASSAFKPAVWYNPQLDRLEFFIANKTGVTHRVDDCLTLVRDGENGAPIGFYLKGLRGIYRHIRRVGLTDDDGFVEAVEMIRNLTGKLIRDWDASTPDGLERLYQEYDDALLVARDVGRVNLDKYLSRLDEGPSGEPLSGAL